MINKLLCFIFALTFISFGAYDSDSLAFRQATFEDYFSGAVEIRINDFDSDGDSDAVVIDESTIFYLRGLNGRLHFQDTISKNLEDCEDIVSVDINGDKNLDFLVVCNIGVYKYLNDGDGNFIESVFDTSKDAYFQSFVAADINGDNLVDFIGSKQYPYELSWYRNKGNGEFSLELISDTLNRRIEKIVVIDIDNDGNNDILGANFISNEIKLFKNNGSEIFSSTLVVPEIDDIDKLICEDINNDGYKDILTLSSLRSDFSFLYNDGTCNFSLSTIYDSLNIKSDTVKCHYQNAALLDMNGDNSLDVVISSGNRNSIYWYKHESNGDFSYHLINDSAENAEDINLLDIDNDDDYDIIYKNRAFNRFKLLLNVSGDIKLNYPKGNETFTTGEEIKITWSGGQSIKEIDFQLSSDQGITWGNILNGIANSDTCNWKIPALSSDKCLLRIVNSQTQTELVRMEYPFTINVMDNQYHLIDSIAGNYISNYDIDSDSDPDFYNDKNWFINNGNGNYEIDTTIPIPLHNTQSYNGLIDIDGDGDIDICSKQSWNENIGNGKYIEHEISEFKHDHKIRGYGDVDDDGDIDLYVNTGSADIYVWYLNDGSENFEINYPTLAFSTLTEKWILPFDGNQDKYMDYVGFASTGSVKYYLGDSSEITETNMTVSIHSSFNDAIITDINSDGRDDIIASTYCDLIDYDDKLAMFENSDTGFIRTYISRSRHRSGIYVCDFDNDSDLDILSVNYFYENTGNRDFKQHQLFITPNFVEDFTVFDYDGDGDNDVIVQCFRNIIWYENKMSEGVPISKNKHVIKSNSKVASVSAINSKLAFHNFPMGKVNVSLYTLNGKKIFNNELNLSTNNRILELPKNYSNSIYIVRAKSAKVNYTKQIILK